MLKGKRGQFYIIAAIIIVIVLVGMASMKNYISVKKEPKNFQSIGNALELEGMHVIENSEYNNGNVQTNIEKYLSLFYNYIDQNADEEFKLVIIYGDIQGTNISGKEYSRVSNGEISLDPGGDTQFTRPGSSSLDMKNISLVVNSDFGRRANVTITSGGERIVQTVPILEDNNFIFVMTTNDDLNRWIRTNIGG